MSARDAVEKSLRSICGAWHACAMGTKRNPLHPADEARGIKAGQLCDDCESTVAAHLKDIFGEERGEADRDGVDWETRAKRAISSLRSYDNGLADHIEKVTLRSTSAREGS